MCSWTLRDVDDRTAVAVAHPLGRRARHEEGAAHVHREEAVEVVDVEVERGLADVGARVVHEHVDAAESLDGLGQALADVAVEEVAGRPVRAPLLRDLLVPGLRLALPGARVEAELVAVLLGRSAIAQPMPV